MKCKVVEQHIRVAVIGSDPLRFVGFRALLGGERNLELIPTTAYELEVERDIDVVLVGGLSSHNLLALIDKLRTTHPELRIIVTAADIDDETIIKAVVAGAKGYVCEASARAEFARAIRVVKQGGLWLSRRVLAQVIERSSHLLSSVPVEKRSITNREREVLQMLVEGKSNKEIAVPLGIEVRTVKAHVGKLLRKVGVQNRIALSVHALTHSLLPIVEESRTD